MSENIFFTKFSELENRLDPQFYKTEYEDIVNRIKKVNFKKLSQCVLFSSEVWNQKDFFSQTFPYIEISEIDLISGKIHNVKQINILEAPSRAKMIVRNQDILISTTRPNRGAISLIDSDNILIASTGFAVIRNCSEQISKKYLFIVLKMDFILKQFEQRSSGGNYPAITLEELSNVIIPVPSKAVQNQIILKMEQAYKRKEEKEKEAQNKLDSIDEYLLNELGIKPFSNEKESLEDRVFFRKFSEISSNRLDAFYYKNIFNEAELNLNKTKNNIVLLKNILIFLESGSRPAGGVGNIENGILSLGGEHVNNLCEIEIKNPKYIPLSFHNKILNTQTKLNDIILVKDGATTGKIGIIRNIEHVNQNINEHVFILRFLDEINPIYILYFLNSTIGQIQIKREITGATVTGLTKEAVNKIKIFLPSLEIQNKIANHIQNLRDEAQNLKNEAIQIFEDAKKEVEKMILGESND